MSESRAAVKVTGTVEIVWNGGGSGYGSGGNGGTESTPKRAFAEFSAHEGAEILGPKGEFCYLVTDLEESIHRKIVADVVAATVDEVLGVAWFVGLVTFDTKELGGGCDGGCSGGHDPHDGSCTDGCSGGGCSGGSGGSGGTKGKHPRTGQWIIVEVHDNGTPAVGNDTISWKWLPSDPIPPTTDPETCPHLCGKSIIGGNLTVHGRN